MPVIFLSHYGQDQLTARSFEMGTDDCVVKLFSATKLLQRIRAALQPQGAAAGPPYVVGDLSIDSSRSRIEITGSEIDLTDTGCRVLVELSTDADCLLTYEQSLLYGLGHANVGDSGPTKAVIRMLRKKLDDDAENPSYIFAKRRVG